IFRHDLPGQNHEHDHKQVEKKLQPLLPAAAALRKDCVDTLVIGSCSQIPPKGVMGGEGLKTLLQGVIRG
ncbi:MAG: hypothetical protein EBY14_12855, partial [Betaproteobacteria bacterium]|nr:hypothetical protein [Betaproteobacteria bacterium]